ncbi:MAG: hypothetical protein KBD05_01740 [Candidatus Pacebacteria bacterium]|nr:hypothetical protein [Candidatus Paceibacterota bacterium]
MNTNLTKKTLLAVLITALVIGPAAAFARNDEDKGNKPIIRPATLVQLTAGGTALVRGGEVTAINDDVVTVQTDLGDVEFTWTVDIDSDTELLTRTGDDFDLEDLEVGDTVSFSGTLESTSRVDASVLKEWSEDEDMNRKDHAKEFGLKLKNWFSSHWGFWEK